MIWSTVPIGSWSYGIANMTRFLQRIVISKYIWIHILLRNHINVTCVVKHSLKIVYKPFKYISGHKGEKPYQCSHCDMDFSNTSDLQMHLILYICGKPNQCSYCIKLFTKNSKFVRHLRPHTGEKPYQCNHCNKSFSQMWSLSTSEYTLWWQISL